MSWSRNQRRSCANDRGSAVTSSRDMCGGSDPVVRLDRRVQLIGGDSVGVAGCPPQRGSRRLGSYGRGGVEGAGQGGDGGAVEDRAQGKLSREPLPYSRHDLRRQQRVPAELEEV